MFESIIELIFKNEGGYVNNPKDPGGETNFGISKRSYPELDIKNLSKTDAKNIYYNDYYLPLNISSVPNNSIQGIALDTAVHSGVNRSGKLIQQALNYLGENLIVDGVIGSKTLSALSNQIKKRGERGVFDAIMLQRERFLRSLDSYSIFGKGWEYRLSKVRNFFFLIVA